MNDSSLVGTVAFYSLGVVCTAVFSYSLNVFLHLDFFWLTAKTMGIPCFTWTVLMLSAASILGARRDAYWRVAAEACALGSALLVPAGLYNVFAAAPELKWSVVNVAVCVAAMSLFFAWRLPRAGFSLRWWWAFNVLICVNMTLFYLAALA